MQMLVEQCNTHTLAFQLSDTSTALSNIVNKIKLKHY